MRTFLAIAVVVFGCIGGGLSIKYGYFGLGGVYLAVVILAALFVVTADDVP